MAKKRKNRTRAEYVAARRKLGREGRKALTWRDSLYRRSSPRSAGSRRRLNPAMKKGKTGTWIKAKAVKVTRVKGKLVVQVKR